MSPGTDDELEKFRRQWKEEMSGRSKGDSLSPNTLPERAQGPIKHNHDTAESSSPRKPPQYSRSKEITVIEDNQDIGTIEMQVSHDLQDMDEARKLGSEGPGVHPTTVKKPSSALDHYEKAVEREEQGSLGDSVSLYRKAYKLDAGVDKAYRNKHFPPSSVKSKPTNINPSNAAVTVPNPAHHSLDGPPASAPTVPDLIASFAGLSIPSIPPGRYFRSCVSALTIRRFFHGRAYLSLFKDCFYNYDNAGQSLNKPEACPWRNRRIVKANDPQF